MLDLDNVPVREDAMTPYEMMLSESQERMLMVLNPSKEGEAQAVFQKWELDFATVGIHHQRSALPGEMAGQHRRRFADQGAGRRGAGIRPARGPSQSRRRRSVRTIFQQMDVADALLRLIGSPCPQLAALGV